MTADVTLDRRVTVPTLGPHTVFVDGSRLFWALPSPVHEGLGYRVLVPDRIQGDAVLSAFVIHGPVQDHVSPVSQPIVPIIQPRAVLATVKAWPGEGGACRKRRATASLDDGCARRCCRIKVGTKKHARSNKETVTSAKSRSPPRLPLDSQPHTRVG